MRRRGAVGPQHPVPRRASRPPGWTAPSRPAAETASPRARRRRRRWPHGPDGCGRPRREFFVPAPCPRLESSRPAPLGRPDECICDGHAVPAGRCRRFVIASRTWCRRRSPTDRRPVGRRAGSGADTRRSDPRAWTPEQSAVVHHPAKAGCGCWPVRGPARPQTLVDAVAERICDRGSARGKHSGADLLAPGGRRADRPDHPPRRAHQHRAAGPDAALLRVLGAAGSGHAHR